MILNERNSHQDISALGGKGKNLYHLSSNGISVPQWFCITADVFDDLIKSKKDDIRKILDTIDYEKSRSIDNASLKIRNLIKDYILPEKLQEIVNQEIKRIGEDSYFAVRSSATAEDSAQFSFAGQFDTFLYVRADSVMEYANECWSSAFTSRILSYLHQKGIDPLEISLAVIVQKMVNSEVSGVMFMANPTGTMNEIVIVAGYGLGEGIVSDQVESDSYYYDKISKEFRDEIDKKEFRIIFDETKKHGTKKSAVPKKMQDISVLSQNQKNSLVETGLKIDSLYSDFQDIEWAFDEEGEIYITQSRPITTIPQGARTILDNSNIVEGYPGITKPLTFSFIKEGYEIIFRNSIKRLGIKPDIISKNQIVFKNMVAYVQGRVFYNLSNWYKMFQLIPGMNRFLSVWEEMLGISEKERSDSQSKRDVFSVIRLIRKFLWYFISLRYQMEKLKKQLGEFTTVFNAHSIDDLNNHELSKLYHDLIRDIIHKSEMTVLNDGYAFLFTGITKKKMKSMGVDDPDNLFNELLCGEQGMESVEPLVSALVLAELIRSNNELRSSLESIVKNDNEKSVMESVSSEILKNKNFSDFSLAFDTHLEKYADRTIEELKLETKSLRDNPSLLIELILGYASSGININEMESREKEIRTRAEKAINSKLRFHPLRKLYFSFVIAMARRSIKYRESARLDRSRTFGIVRNIFNALGKNLYEEGALESQDDIFYLSVEEIVSYIYGSSVNNSLPWIIKKRKNEEKKYKKLNPAERILFQGTAYLNPVPQKDKGNFTLSSGDNLIHGTGCSPGVVIGEAVIVTDPRNTGDINGKILVSEMTDPGWVFLMVSAAGLIVEKGSLLSHTAIIGRELGIPTIVGVKGASSIIKNGSTITMDGKRGEISLSP